MAVREAAQDTIVVDDGDVTHFKEDDDPEAKVGEPVTVDLGEPAAPHLEPEVGA